MALTSQEYVAQLRALLPGGPAWGDGITARLLEGWAEEFKRVDERISALVEEADPRKADELLPEWERLLGLPDECTQELDLSLGERRRLAWQKLTATGGASRAYFIGLAETLGVAGVTITEFRQFSCQGTCNDPVHSLADEFVWRVNVPQPLDNVRPMNCGDDCTDALQQYTPNLIECPIRDRRPAHTAVIFGYPPSP